MNIPNAAALAQAFADADVLNDMDVSPVRPVVGRGHARFFFADDGLWEYRVTVERLPLKQPVPDKVAIDAAVARYLNVAGPCPCECNSGGFCGGCGHAGCGRR